MKKSIHLVLSSLIALLGPTTMLLTYSHPVGAEELSDPLDQEPLREDYWEDDYLIDHYPMPLPDGPIYSDPIYEYLPGENGNVDRTLCINCRSLFSDPVPLSTSIPEPSNLLGYIILGGMILGRAIKGTKK